MPRRHPPGFGLRPLILLAMLVAPGAAPDPTPLPPLNEKVVAFARSLLGKKVGDGQCLTLAIFALRSAGAGGYSLREPNGDFVWGTLIEQPREAKPGDVLQFRDAVFKGKRYITKRRWITWHQEYAHHTAIVAEVRDQGKTLIVLHQNVGNAEKDPEKVKTVQEGTLRMDSLQPGGWVRIYRPVAASSEFGDG
jgi:hypothetical protein